jgi:cell division protein FtsI (penicillin-binding protein 3)
MSVMQRLVPIWRMAVRLCRPLKAAFVFIVLRFFSPANLPQKKLNAHSRGRIAFAASSALFLYIAVAAKIFITASAGEEASTALTGSVKTSATRADITDRSGNVLATNIDTHSLYAHPNQIVDLEKVITNLLKIFPNLEEEKLRKDLRPSRKFAWVRRRISPEQMAKVHDIGDPGLLFGRREMRFYPNENLAAHVLGGYRFGKEGVHDAEIIGIAGAEGYFNDLLNDPERDAPLRLSIDLPTQNAIEDVLEGGMKMLGAKGASAIVMDAKSGRIRAMASLPDFNPNDRPSPLLKGDPADSPIFNRAVQGVYELGSVFKVFPIAQALDLGLVTPNTMMDTKGPMRVGRHKIRDFHDYGPRLSVTDVLVESSNIGTARLAMMINPERQKEFHQKLGLLDASGVELLEARNAKPLLPQRWTGITSMTISYGHGLSTSPTHLAAAYATILTGGERVYPTLLEDSQTAPGERIIGESTSAKMRKMIRAVVTEGTASFARNTGYSVGGKTGTADKVKPGGGYHRDKVLATFATAVPAENPEYIVVVTFDEPVDHTLGHAKRTAGWTAVPITGEAIRRIGPLLDITYTPEEEPEDE